MPTGCQQSDTKHCAVAHCLGHCVRAEPSTSPSHSGAPLHTWHLQNQAFDRQQWGFQEQTRQCSSVFQGKGEQAHADAHSEFITTQLSIHAAPWENSVTRAELQIQAALQQELCSECDGSFQAPHYTGTERLRT